MATGDPHGGRARTPADARASSGLAVAGFVAVAVGSLGPWVTSGLGSVNGTHGDGVITLIAAGVGGLGLALNRVSRTGIVIAGLAALVAAGTAGYDIVHIERSAASAGWGVYVAFVGALAVVIAVAVETPRTPRTVTWVIAPLGAAAVFVAGPIGAAGTSEVRPTANPRSASFSATNPRSAPSVAASSTSSGARPRAGHSPPAVGGIGQSAATSPGADGLRHCNPSVLAGPATSCPFAENVFKAVVASYRKSRSLPFAVFVSSPETRQLRSVSCVLTAGQLRCVDPTGSLAMFSPRSVQAGNP